MPDKPKPDDAGQTREGTSKRISSEDVIVFGFLSAVSLWTYVFLPLLYLSSKEGHTMSGDNWTDVAIAISGIASAIGASVAAGAALYAARLAKQASKDWRRSLEYQRIDKAIEAVLELRSNAYRWQELMRIKVSKGQVSDAYSDAWRSCNRFEQAYVVAQHYPQSQSLPPEPWKEFAKLLHQLRDHSNVYDQERVVSDEEKEVTEKQVTKIIEKIHDLAESTKKTLRETLNGGVEGGGKIK
jgi:hypothetical protein